jgi:hypothetical protein
VAFSPKPVTPSGLRVTIRAVLEQLALSEQFLNRFIFNNEK